MLDLSVPRIPDTQAIPRTFVEDAADISDIVPLVPQVLLLL